MSDETEWGEINDRDAICRMLTQLFAHWKLTGDECIALLDLPPDDVQTGLTEPCHNHPMALTSGSLERAGHLLGIHKSLRRLFPQNRDLAYAWMKTSNLAFDGKTPINFICEWGLAGLLVVRAYLDAVSE